MRCLRDSLESFYCRQASPSTPRGVTGLNGGGACRKTTASQQGEVQRSVSSLHILPCPFRPDYGQKLVLTRSGQMRTSAIGGQRAPDSALRCFGGTRTSSLLPKWSTYRSGIMVRLNSRLARYAKALRIARAGGSRSAVARNQLMST